MTQSTGDNPLRERISLLKKDFSMKWVKQTVGYWCDDTKTGKCTGSGICAAVLDTGISVHPDLQGRIVGFRDFVNGSGDIYDDSGHGTHVAGILAGNGRASEGIYAGMAPEAELLIAKVLDKNGDGDVDKVVRGIEWILSVKEQFRVRIVNISVGTQPELACEQKRRLLNAVEQLWDAGLVVVVSAGNYGPGPGTVAVPGNSRKVITAGVPDMPAGRAGRRKRLNYSGRGPTEECVIKPDVFAPGTGIISCNGRYSLPGEHIYVMKSGDFHGDSGRVRSRGLPAVKISGYDKRGSKAETESVLCKISGDRGRMGACQCRTAPGGVSYSLHLTAARMRPRNRCKEKILDSLPAFVYDTRGDSDE